MRLCDLDEIKVCVDRQYENCHGYSGSKKAIYREAILAVKSILHSVKPIDAVPVVRCRECKYHEDTSVSEDFGTAVSERRIRFWMNRMLYLPNYWNCWRGKNEPLYSKLQFWKR